MDPPVERPAGFSFPVPLVGEGDAAEIRRALNAVALSLGMAAIAEEAGLGRERLYKALSDAGNPEFSTVLKLMKAMGLKLSALPIDKK